MSAPGRPSRRYPIERQAHPDRQQAIQAGNGGVFIADKFVGALLGPVSMTFDDVVVTGLDYDFRSDKRCVTATIQCHAGPSILDLMRDDLERQVRDDMARAVTECLPSPLVRTHHGLGIDGLGIIDWGSLGKEHG